MKPLKQDEKTILFGLGHELPDRRSGASLGVLTGPGVSTVSWYKNNSLVIVSVGVSANEAMVTSEE